MNISNVKVMENGVRLSADMVSYGQYDDKKLDIFHVPAKITTYLKLQ